MQLLHVEVCCWAVLASPLGGREGNSPKVPKQATSQQLSNGSVQRSGLQWLVCVVLLPVPVRCGLSLHHIGVKAITSAGTEAGKQAAECSSAAVCILCTHVCGAAAAVAHHQQFLVSLVTCLNNTARQQQQQQ